MVVQSRVKLSWVEQSLVDHVRDGEWFDLTQEGEEVDEAAMRSWGGARTCRAVVIRDILRGRLVADLDPHGLRLRGARIIGQIDLENLNTEVNLQLESCFLEEGLLARDARLSTVSLVGCLLEHPTESPLSADRLLCNALSLAKATIIGHTEDGAVRLLGAHIEGQLSCTGTCLRNDSGAALLAENLQVDDDILLYEGFTAEGSGNHVTIDLVGARVDGALLFDPACLRHDANPRGRLRVDGLTYANVPRSISAEHWLELLREGTPCYAAQPYQQLAAGYRALGDERQARKILMEQRDAQLDLAYPRPSWQERLWGKITKFTLGYGYQPWRALLFLVAVVALSCVLAILLGSHGALVQTAKTATPGRPCTVVQQVSVGLDLNLPVGTSVARAGCDLSQNSASATAAWLTAAGWTLRLLAWAFAALFIAGFTSAVRKT